MFNFNLNQHTKYSMQGVTLLELMIVIVIVGILVSIALPSYTEFINKGRRADGMAALMDSANRQEQFMFDRNRYAQTMAELGMGATSTDGHYTVTIDAADASCPINRCYSLRATPAASSPQVDDLKCTAFTLTSAGNKGATGTAAASCWTR